MRFGLLYEHQLPRPWTEGTEHRLFKDALAQVELADRSASITSGKSSITSSRNMPIPRRRRFSSPPAPRAPRSIRIGHGVVLAPPGYNHPARVAERIATLDLISDGRVDWGTGESASRVELEGFGIDPDQKKAMWAEAVEQTANMMAMSPYPGFKGKFFAMPVRNVVPEALAEAASADLGGVQPPRDHPCRGAGRHRRAHLRLRRSGRGRQVGARILRHHQERGVRADRPHGERQRRHGDRLLLPRGSRRGAAARRRGLPVLRLFARPLLRLRPSSARRHRRLAALRGGQGQAAGRRAGQRHRHAGRAHRASAELPGGRRRPGRVHPAGRPQQARAHLRFAEPLRRQGDAGAEGRPGGARCEEAGRAGALHRGGAQAQEEDGAGRARGGARRSRPMAAPSCRRTRPPKARPTISPPTSP